MRNENAYRKEEEGGGAGECKYLRMSIGIPILSVEINKQNHMKSLWWRYLWEITVLGVLWANVYVTVQVRTLGS